MHGERHGGEVYALAHKLKTAPENLLDFSSNVNMFAAPLTQELVEQTPYPFLHYPDSGATCLRTRIAAFEGVEEDRVLVGNGSAELIWYLLTRLAPRHVLFVGPAFSEYVTACEALGIRYTIITPPAERGFAPGAAELATLWRTDADLVVLCSPNNPAGTVYENMPELLQMTAAPRVLIDSTYRDFLAGEPAYELNSHAAYKRSLRPGVSLFTLHSFTKFFCCPGIRLGYLMGDRPAIARLELKRPSWTVSPFALLMGEAFLERMADYRATLPALRGAVAHLGRELRRIALFSPDDVWEGVSFVTARLRETANTPAVTAALLRQHMLVRNCDSIPGMPKGYVRIAARSADAMEKITQALRYLR